MVLMTDHHAAGHWARTDGPGRDGEITPEAIPEWFRKAICAPFRRRSVTVAHCALNYLTWGDPDKPPLVLVHGGAAHAFWWSPLAPQLARHYHVIVPDLSGHGDSGRRETYPIERWAEEVMAVSEDAAADRLPILVGHSMGGLVSLVAASIYGAQRIAGAIIVDSPAGTPDPESDERRDYARFRNPRIYPDLQTALARFRLIPEQPCEARYILDHIARHSLVQTAAGWTWKFDPKVFLSTPRISLHDYLAVDCRIALMRGEFSVIVPPEEGEYMCQLLDGSAPLIEIPQAHHHLILDQPLAFIAALRALLADWQHSVPQRRLGPR